MMTDFIKCVRQSGATQKAYGRVSHAKVKSLIFYACKFDQQRDRARFVGHRPG
jgi:hypothetical protein